MTELRLFGLIGFPLTHSFSPDYFRQKFQREHIEAAYNPFVLETISQLPELLQNYPSLEGLNVTIPYKESVMPYLDELSALARETGAVNCIRIADGKLTGYNTDVAGFCESLKPLLNSQHQHALVLGTGGASKAVQFGLKELGIGYQLVSRREEQGKRSYTALTRRQMRDYQLIINTTPVGMYPDTEACPPLPYEVIGPDHLLFDLIYNPEETRFLAEGRKRGAITKNGLEMLQLQAEESWKIWNE